jgi:hypothetical protein
MRVHQRTTTPSCERSFGGFDSELISRIQRISREDNSVYVLNLTPLEMN